jgi:hypothetical protein
MFHSHFHATDMHDVDIVLAYPHMDSIHAINVNVRRKFLKFGTRKIK